MRLKTICAMAVALGLPALLVSDEPQREAAGRVAPPSPPGGLTATSDDGMLLGSAAPFIAPPGMPMQPNQMGMFPRGPGGQGMMQNMYSTMFPSGPGAQYMSMLNEFQPMTPGEAKLAMEARELGKKLGEAKGKEDQAKLKEQLTTLLGKQFDLRQKRHQDEIKALEEKLKKLKELVDKRQENRGEIVAKRLDQILSEAEGLGW